MPAGTITVDRNLPNFPQEGGMHRIIVDWVADASGNVNRTVDINGTITRVVYVPSAVAAPTAGYNVTLTDAGGVDVLMGTGAGLSATVTKNDVPIYGTANFPVCVADSLTLVVAGAGNAKAGRVIIYYR